MDRYCQGWGAGAGRVFWPLGAGAARKNIPGAGASSEKKSGAGAAWKKNSGAAKKFSASPVLVTAVQFHNLIIRECKTNLTFSL